MHRSPTAPEYGSLPSHLLQNNREVVRWSYYNVGNWECMLIACGHIRDEEEFRNVMTLVSGAEPGEICS